MYDHINVTKRTVHRRERERETAFGEGKESYGIREGIKRSWACGEEKRGAYKVAVFASLSANRKARIQCTGALLSASILAIGEGLPLPFVCLIIFEYIIQSLFFVLQSNFDYSLY